MVIPDEIGSAYVPRDRALSHGEYETLWMTLNENRRDHLDGWCYEGPRESELEFGSAISVSGDTLAVGATLDFTSGAVYIFVRNGTTWWWSPTPLLITSKRVKLRGAGPPRPSLDLREASGIEKAGFIDKACEGRVRPAT